MNSKKTAVLVVALIMSFSASVASAQEVVTLNISNGNPESQVSGWGLTGFQTSKFSAGQSVSDEAGEKYTCPLWMGKMMCADITKTDYYRKNHIEVARQLVQKNLLSKFPSFTYWSKFVK